MTNRGSVNIVGAGPGGALLAILLRRRGLQVTLYESRTDPRSDPGESGRSINLALADRGIHALKSAGVWDAIAATLVPMRGRLIHQKDGTQSLQLYGQRPSEVIYSISRHRLNQALLDVAIGRHAEVKFEHRLEDVDFESGTAQLRDMRCGRLPDAPSHGRVGTHRGGRGRSRAWLQGIVVTRGSAGQPPHGARRAAH